MEVEDLSSIIELAKESQEKGDALLAEACISFYAMRSSRIHPDRPDVGPAKTLPDELLAIAHKLMAVRRDEDWVLTNALNEKYPHPNQHPEQAAGADAFLSGFIDGRTDKEKASEDENYVAGYELAEAHPAP